MKLINLLLLLLGGNLEYNPLSVLLHDFAQTGDLDVEEFRRLLSKCEPPKWLLALLRWYSDVEYIVRYSIGIWNGEKQLPNSEQIHWDVCHYCDCAEKKHAAEARCAYGPDLPSDCISCPYRAVKFAYDHRARPAFGMDEPPTELVYDPYVGTMPPPPPSPTHPPLREQPAPAGYYGSLHTRPASSTEQPPPVGYYHPWNYNPQH